MISVFYYAAPPNRLDNSAEMMRHQQIEMFISL